MATQATTAKAKAKAKKAPARKPAAKKAAAKKTTARKTTAKKPVQPTFAEKAQENARNVFLAGLGFYGKAFEEAQSQLEEAEKRMKARQKKAEDMFNDLVKHGEKVESKAKKRLKDIDLPELKLADTEELRTEIRARLDKARDSFESLRETISARAA